MRVGFWRRNLREKKSLGRRRIRWEDNINMVFKKWDGGHELD